MHKIVLKSGKKIEIDVPEKKAIDSFFIFGIHKSGSTLLAKIFYDICNTTNIAAISIDEHLFKLGVSVGDINTNINVFKPKNYCYCGFRRFWPKTDKFDFKNTKKILLVRDPRDAMISYYFSAKYSHSIPKNIAGNAGEKLLAIRNKLLESDDDNDKRHLDYIEYQGKFLRNNMREYLKKIDDNTQIYRYEDIIFNKEAWILSMCNYLGIEIDLSSVKQIAKKHDLIPDAENSKKHIRSVIPGNYRKHYSDKIIDYLNEYFQEELKALNYLEVPYYQLNENQKLSPK